jgi:hypothetical protein
MKEEEMETGVAEKPKEMAKGIPSTARTKTCPRCGATLFEDMDVCYGCLYDFRHVPEPLGLPTLEMGQEGQPDEGIWINGPFIDEDAMPASGCATARIAPQDVIPEEGRQTTEGAAAEVPDEAIAARWPEGADPDATLVEGADPVRKAVGEVGLRMRSGGIEATIGVGENGLTIGRDADNDVVLFSRSVSRHHLRMAPSEGGVLVRDLGATNPATVDGKPVSGDVVVLPGTVVDVCGTTFEVLVDR